MAFTLCSKLSFCLWGRLCKGRIIRPLTIFSQLYHRSFRLVSILQQVILFWCCFVSTSGINCSTNINECASNPCAATATCEDLVDSYNCACPIGFFGPTCSEELNECGSAPCMNGATCVEGVGGYICQCVLGFTGVTCGVDTDECQSSPCQNTGKWINTLKALDSFGDYSKYILALKLIW